MTVLEEIDIDFQVLKTGDPNLLIICDTSQWSHIRNFQATMQITLPNETVITHNVPKGQNSVYNSSNLKLSQYGKFEPLPDGVYKLKLTGTPANYTKTRYVIRDERLQLDIDKLFLKNFNTGNKNLISKIQDINLMLEASRASIRRDEKADALKYYEEAKSMFDNYQECKDCR